MRIAPKQIEIGRQDGFKPENDLFGYSEFGKNLCGLIGEIEGSGTIVLDGAWGSGKSVFARQLAGEMRKAKLAVIEFDAFENDYLEDAFVALAGEISRVARAFLPEQDQRAKRFTKSAAQLGKMMLPVVAKGTIALATGGIVRSDTLEQVGEAARDGAEVLVDSSSEAVENWIEQKLLSRESEREDLEQFRRTLREVIDGLQSTAAEEAKAEQNDSHGPIVIVIDELDRCRPTFALQILERIKHLFEIDGLVFLLVTNASQLEGVVKKVYGVESPGDYLEKFVNLRVFIPQPTSKDAPVSDTYLEYLFESFSLKSDKPELDRSVRKHLGRLSAANELSLRTLERLVLLCGLVFRCTESGVHRTNVPLIAGLVLIRHLKPGLYLKARNDRISWEEVSEALQIEKVDSESSSDWLTRVWRTSTDYENLPEDEKKKAWEWAQEDFLDSPYEFVREMIIRIDSLESAWLGRLSGT